MAKYETFINLLGHYKYLITIVLGGLFVTVLTDYSAMNLVKLDMQRSDLESEIKRYNRQAQDAEQELEALKTRPEAVERVARERYFMNKEGEDVFVLSTDLQTKEESDGDEE